MVTVDTWTIKRPPEGMRTPVATIEGLTADPIVTVVNKDPREFIITVDRRKPAKPSGVPKYRIWLEISAGAPIGAGDTLSFLVNGSAEAPYDVLQGLCLVDTLAVVEVRDPNLPEPDNIVPSMGGVTAHTYRHVYYPEKDGEGGVGPTPFARLLLSGGSNGSAYSIDIDEEDTPEFPDGVSAAQTGRVILLQMAGTPDSIHVTRAAPQTKTIFTSIQDVGLSAWSKHVLTALADPRPGAFQAVPGKGTGAGIVPAFDASSGVPVDVFSFEVEPTPFGVVAAVKTTDPRFSVRQCQQEQGSRYVVSLCDASVLGRVDFDRGALVEITENSRRFVKPEGVLSSVYLYKPMPPSAIALTLSGPVVRRHVDGDADSIVCSVFKSDLPQVVVTVDYDYPSYFVNVTANTLLVDVDPIPVDAASARRMPPATSCALLSSPVNPSRVNPGKVDVQLTRAALTGVEVEFENPESPSLTCFATLRFQAALTSSVSGETYTGADTVVLRVYADPVPVDPCIHAGFVDEDAQEEVAVLPLSRLVSEGMFDALCPNDLTVEVAPEESRCADLQVASDGTLVFLPGQHLQMGRATYRVSACTLSHPDFLATTLVLERYRLPPQGAAPLVSLAFAKALARAVDGGSGPVEACVTLAALGDVQVQWSLGDLQTLYLPPGISVDTQVVVGVGKEEEGPRPVGCLSAQVQPAAAGSGPQVTADLSARTASIAMQPWEAPAPGSTNFVRLVVTVQATYSINGTQYTVTASEALRVYADSTVGPPGPTDLGVCDTVLYPVGAPVMGLVALVQGGLFDVVEDLDVAITTIGAAKAGADPSLPHSSLALDPATGELAVSNEPPTKDIAAYEVHVRDQWGALYPATSFSIVWREPLRVALAIMHVAGNGAGSTLALTLDGGLTVAVSDSALCTCVVQAAVSGGAAADVVDLVFSVVPDEGTCAPCPYSYAVADSQALLDMAETLQVTTPLSHAAPPAVFTTGGLHLSQPLGPCTGFTTRYRRFLLAATVGGARVATLALEVYSALQVAGPGSGSGNMPPPPPLALNVPVDTHQVGDPVLPYSAVIWGGVARVQEDLHITTSGDADVLLLPSPSTEQFVLGTVPTTQVGLGTAYSTLVDVADLETATSFKVTTAWVLGDGSSVVAAPPGATTCVLGFGTFSRTGPWAWDCGVQSQTGTWLCPGVQGGHGGDLTVLLRGVHWLPRLPRSTTAPTAALYCGSDLVPCTSAVFDVVDGFRFTLTLTVAGPVLAALDPNAKFSVVLGGEDADDQITLPAVLGVVSVQVTPDGGQRYESDKVTVNYLGTNTDRDPVYRDYQLGPYETLDDTRVFLSNSGGILRVKGPGSLVLGFLSAAHYEDGATSVEELGRYAEGSELTFVADSGVHLGPVLRVHPDGHVTDLQDRLLVPSLQQVTAVSLRQLEVQGSEDFLLVVLQEGLALTQNEPGGRVLAGATEVVEGVVGAGFLHRFRTVNNIPVFTDVQDNQSLLVRMAAPGAAAAVQFPDCLRLALVATIIPGEQDVANLLFSLEARVPGGEWWVLATNAERPGQAPVSSQGLAALLAGSGPDGHPWPERAHVYDKDGVYCMWEPEQVLQYRLMVQNAVARRLRGHPMVQVGLYDVRSHRGPATVMQYNDYQSTEGQVIRFLVPDGCDPSLGTALVQAHSKKLITVQDRDLCYFEIVPQQVPAPTPTPTPTPTPSDGYVLTKNGASESHMVDTYVFPPDSGASRFWAMTSLTTTPIHYVRMDIRAIVGEAAVTGTAVFVKRASGDWVAVQQDVSDPSTLTFSVDGGGGGAPAATTTMTAVFTAPPSTRVCAVMNSLTV
jgi:hypothetical protein